MTGNKPENDIISKGLHALCTWCGFDEGISRQIEPLIPFNIPQNVRGLRESAKNNYAMEFSKNFDFNSYVYF